MTKYIVKNCPTLVDLLSAEKEELLKKKYCINASEYCADITDCPIKQVVEMCKKKLNKIYDPLAKQILQTLQVEEVE